MTDQKVEYLLGFGARRGVAHEQGDYRVFPISGERLTSLRRLPLAIDATDSPVELRPPHWPNSGHQTLSGGWLFHGGDDQNSTLTAERVGSLWRRIIGDEQSGHRAPPHRLG
jgi:hypothetical protein